MHHHLRICIYDAYDKSTAINRVSFSTDAASNRIVIEYEFKDKYIRVDINGNSKYIYYQTKTNSETEWTTICYIKMTTTT